MSIFTAHPQTLFSITLVGAWLGAILIVAEGLNRFTSVSSEVSRKVVHIGSGNVILLAWWLQIPAWIGIGAGILSGAIALISYKFPILPSINSVGRTSFGTFFYAATIGILIAWFWPLHLEQYAALGILIMTWGDGLAAIIGRRFGNHSYQIGGIKKSWEGSLAMCLVSYLICSLILLGVEGNIWQTWIVSLAVALTATSLEAFSKWGIDNLTVPVGSAALCYWLIGVFS